LPSQAKVWAFGSRAKGTAKPYSDLDLVIDLGEIATLSLLAKLANDFEETTLPFKVDIVDWQSISEPFQNNILTGRIALAFN
jgi:uncharacterized protein